MKPKSLNLFSLATGWGDQVISKFSNNDLRCLGLMCDHNDSALAVIDFVNYIPDLSDFGYWDLLGALYIHGGYSTFMTPKTWRRLFQAPRPQKKYVMKSFERKALKVLPKRVTCYRIHHPNEKDWISYTVSGWLVPKFVEDYKEHGAFQSVDKYRVNKKDIDFFFGRNNEDEVIILDRSKVKKIGADKDLQAKKRRA